MVYRMTWLRKRLQAWKARVARVRAQDGIAPPPDVRLQAMVDAGLAEWNGKPLRAVRAAARVEAGHSVADLVVEERI